MRVNNYKTQNTFTGYDARRLAGLFVTDKYCIEQLRRITSQYELDVYTPQIVSKSIRKDYADLARKNNMLWAQDFFMFLANKAVLFDASREHLTRVLRGCADGVAKQLKLKPIKMDVHIRGGNYFVCNVNGKRKLIIAEGRQYLPDELLKISHDVDEICPIPKADFHVDLFLRPLDNGNVLLADNKLTVESLKKLEQGYADLIKQGNLTKSESEAYTNIVEQISLLLSKFEITEKFDRYKPRETTEEIATRLQEYGFNPIRVPGNYYSLDKVKTREKEEKMMANFEKNMAAILDVSKAFPQAVREKAKIHVALQREIVKHDPHLGVELESFYDSNFLNSIVFKDKNGKLVYITNASLFDRGVGITPEIERKTGLSLANSFIESISPYVDRENIHFIDEKLTERLFKYMGGIHCSAAEIPA